jgi:hypothetical protein
MRSPDAILIDPERAASRPRHLDEADPWILTPRLPTDFLEDVESVVRDNAASLRVTDFGFEAE